MKRPNEKLRELQQELNQHFDASPNKETLDQWRESYKRRLEELCKEEQLRINQCVAEYQKLKLLQIGNNPIFEDFKNKFVKKAEEMARNLKIESKKLLERDLLKHFSDMLEKSVLEFKSKHSVQKDHMEDILEAIKSELYRVFSKNMTVLEEVLNISPLGILEQCNLESPLNIDMEDLTLKDENFFQKNCQQG